jgi:adenylate kinase family enzyme
MKRVAIFGNAGGGKSTLAKRLADMTGLPLFVVDKMRFLPGGAEVPRDGYATAHADVLRNETWIIDGFENIDMAWERFARADTLIHVDMAIARHYWWVTKRFAKGFFADPEGWPENSPLWSSTLSSYSVISRCHRHLTPRYRQLLMDLATSKRTHHLRTPNEMADFLDAVRQELKNKADAAE